MFMRTHKTMKTQTSARIITLSLAFAIILSPMRAGFAAEAGLSVEKHADAPVENRFVVGPAKIETTVNAGEVKTVSIDLENRTGRTEVFSISFEDFVASQDENKTVELLGNASSNTSLKNTLSVPQSEVSLAHGDRVRIPVTISIPASETPGGKFGSVVVSATVPNSQVAKNDVKSGAVVVGRVVSLLFVTVPGEITHSGLLESARIAKNQSVFFGTPITVQAAYRNSGSTYENPYGGVSIVNMFGSVVSKTAIDPWFVLPNSLRTREVTVSSKGLFGYYTAKVEMNRGYGDTVDTKEISFFAFDPLTLILLMFVLLGLGGIARKRFVRV